MMKLLDFVKTYDVMEDEFCKGLISLFKNNESQHRHNDNKVQRFTEWNFTQNSSTQIQPIIEVVLTALDKYLADVPQYYRNFSEGLSLEEFRVKRYRGGTDEQFDWHVDVGDKVSCKRYLSFLFYLNDEYEGGETEFRETTFTPKKGTVLIFPPTWQYPHRGCPVTSGDKYIMSTYLTYP